MTIFLNILLGLATAAASALLLLQGFVLPDLAPWIDVLLRIGAAFFAQWLFFRACQKKALKCFPLLIAALVTVWGYFLYLTSPSWRNATFGHFLGDYASFFLACAAFWGLRWLLPRATRPPKRICPGSDKSMPRFSGAFSFAFSKNV